MKTSQLNTDNKPSLESASEIGGQPCFATDPKIACLNVRSDDGRSYLLPYALFLRAETSPNPAVENSPDAPPQKMTISFTWAVVTLLGSGLSVIERGLQALDLQFVKSAPPGLPAATRCHITAVHITFSKENV
jgi:hypothetical protein